MAVKSGLEFMVVIDGQYYPVSRAAEIRDAIDVELKKYAACMKKLQAPEDEHQEE